MPLYSIGFGIEPLEVNFVRLADHWENRLDSTHSNMLPFAMISYLQPQ